MRFDGLILSTCNIGAEVQFPLRCQICQSTGLLVVTVSPTNNRGDMLAKSSRTTKPTKKLEKKRVWE